METEDDRAKVRWLVSGRVQGVGFRYHVVQAARRSGVVGDVRNLRDGRVEVRAVGDVRGLAELLREVRTGPRGARVDDVRQSAIDGPLDFVGFDVRYDA